MNPWWERPSTAKYKNNVFGLNMGYDIQRVHGMKATLNLDGEEINLPINILLTSVAQNLIRNIEKNVASISVDLNIIENLIKYSTKYKSIMVFTGLAHAIRIEQVLLNLGGYSPKSQGKDNPEYFKNM